MRVGFSFISGMIVYRIGRQPALPFSALWLPLILLATFFWPFQWRAYDFLAAVVVYPLIVWLGANAIGTPVTTRIYEAMGDLSYPLYMTHYALVMVLLGGMSAGWVLPTHAVFVVPGLTLAAIAFAHAVHKYIDAPVRAALSRGSRRRAPRIRMA